MEARVASHSTISELKGALLVVYQEMRMKHTARVPLKGSEQVASTYVFSRPFPKGLKRVF